MSFLIPQVKIHTLNSQIILVGENLFLILFFFLNEFTLYKVKCLCVEPSAETWENYQWPHLQKTMVFSPPAPVSWWRGGAWRSSCLSMSKFLLAWYCADSHTQRTAFHSTWPPRSLWLFHSPCLPSHSVAWSLRGAVGVVNIDVLLKDKQSVPYSWHFVQFCITPMTVVHSQEKFH